jgi:hypothetical protein
MDPFPGSMGQIWQAKILDDKPEFPVSSALCLMLKQEEEKKTAR